MARSRAEPASGERRSTRAPVAGGLLALGCLLLVDAGVRPRRSEGRVLRWTRVAAEHPLRTGLAFLLLLGGALPGPRPLPRLPEGGGGSRAGAGPSDRTEEGLGNPP